MSKLTSLFLFIYIYGALGNPIQKLEYLDDLDNEAEVIEAGEWLPGIDNLNEKRVPVIRLVVPGNYIGLYGTSNLGERTQIPHNYDSLPGLMNLQEKSIPEEVIARIYSSRHPKSEVEQI